MNITKGELKMDREIGGYIQLEKNRMLMLHEDGIALNCGRSGLSYLIQVKGIKKIAIPWFMCDCIRNLCKKESVEVRYYSVDVDFRPLLSNLEKDEWLYFVNYYGQFDNNVIQKYCRKFGRVIVDQAQSYFQIPIPGVDTIYTCRKFFGVADGGFLYTNAPTLNNLPMDESFERMHFLLGRFERSASEFYEEYVQNNEVFDNEPVKQMSLLTDNLLRGIDYERVKDIRTENFEYLHKRLNEINQLNLRIPEGAFAYPLLISNGQEIRKMLLQNKIYIPTLWPNVLEDCDVNSLEYKMASDILPLPCDQRYSVSDMEYLCSKLLDAIEEINERKQVGGKADEM